MRSDKCDLNDEEVLKEVQVTQTWEQDLKDE